MRSSSANDQKHICHWLDDLYRIIYRHVMLYVDAEVTEFLNMSVAASLVRFWTEYTLENAPICTIRLPPLLDPRLD